MSDVAAATHRANQSVTDAVRAHHDELDRQLRAGTSALLTAAREGQADAQREQLHEWYRTELLPHAQAEERTLYRAGADGNATRLLVQGMIVEHRALAGLVDRLAHARDLVDLVVAAGSAQELFGVHLAKENDLLLPALDRAGVELAPLLADMHELLGAGSA